MGMLRNRSEAEDCVQEAFLKAFQAWANFSPDVPAEAWLHRIMVNVVLSHIRSQKLRTVGEIIRRIGHPSPSPDPSDLSKSRLMAALQALPPKQAAAIVFRYLHGYSNREIAYALKIPERTVASRLIAAKKQLRIILEEK